MNGFRLLPIALLVAALVPATRATAQLSLLPANPATQQAASNNAASNNAAAKNPDAVESAEDTAAKRAENARRLRLAQLDTNNNGTTASGETSNHVELFKTVDAVLAQQQAVDQQTEDLKSRQQELQQELESLPERGVGVEPPYSFLLYDRLRDEAAAEKARSGSLADKVAAATAARQQAESALDQRERARRQAKTAVDENGDPERSAALAAALATAEQESALARETVTLRKKELAREKLAQEVQTLAVQLAEAKVAEVSQHVEFSPSSLEQQLAQVQKQEDDVKLEITLAESNLRRAEKQWTDARNQYDEGSGDRKQLAEKVEAWRLAREELYQKINVLNRQLQRLTQARAVWERRFQIVAGQPTDEELRTWLSETRQQEKELDREARVQRTNIEERRKLAATLDTKAEGATQEAPESAHWISQQVAHVRGMLQLYEQELAQIENGRRLHDKLVKQIAPDSLKIAPGEWWATVRRTAVGFWNYQLAAIEDKPIYVKSIIKALLLLVAGILVSRFLAALIAHQMLRKSSLSRDAKAAIRKLVFYSLLLVVLFMALATAKVPLTVFTVIGGALALGIGLGSQNLVNNFLSGLIMLAERPVRLGDRIVFGDYDGFVEEVGFRSTRVRLLTDHVVTVPNANLVNDAIENIERRRSIRRLFNVTITYDTPREKIVEAVQAIRDILEEEGIREPIHPVFGWDEFPPRVCFNEYNSDSLNILVVYWYAPPNFWDYLLHAERVNLRIYEEFERLGVEFAFPTQTLHLAQDERRRLAIRVLSNDLEPSDSAA